MNASEGRPAPALRYATAGETKREPRETAALAQRAQRNIGHAGAAFLVAPGEALAAER